MANKQALKGIVNSLMDTVMDAVENEKQDQKKESGQSQTQKTYFCAFCGEDEEDLGNYNVGKKNVYICDECIYEMNRQYYNQK